MYAIRSGLQAKGRVAEKVAGGGVTLQQRPHRLEDVGRETSLVSVEPDDPLAFREIEAPPEQCFDLRNSVRAIRTKR